MASSQSLSKEGSSELPIFRGDPVLALMLLPSGYLVYQPGSHGERDVLLCAASDIDECLGYMKRALENCRGPREDTPG